VTDEEWMAIALEEARLARTEGEVPIGAVAVLQGQLLARDHNRSIQLCDPSAHAEILVVRTAGSRLSNYRLGGVELYVTLEPCAMCAGALIWGRVARLVYGATDEKAGAVVSRTRLLNPGLFNHTVEVTAGVRAEECRRILRDFFEARRQTGG
jgi:tRNA(adenine34) deaminase